MTVEAAPNVNLFTSFATAYETPTTVELSNTPTGEGGFNQELGPQDLRSFEFGVRGLAEAAPPALRGGGVRLHRGQRPRLVSRARPRRSSSATPASRPGTASSCCSSGSRTPRSAPGSPIRTRTSSSCSSRPAATTSPATSSRGRRRTASSPASTTPRRSACARWMTVRWVDDYTLDNANTRCSTGRTRWSICGSGSTRPGGGVDVRPFVGIDNLFRRDLQLVHHHQRVRQPLLRAVPRPRVLRGADDRWGPALGVGTVEPRCLPRGGADSLAGSVGRPPSRCRSSRQRSSQGDRTGRPATIGQARVGAVERRRLSRGRRRLWEAQTHAGVGRAGEPSRPATLSVPGRTGRFPPARGDRAARPDAGGRVGSP